jgi:hypothetical protein
MVRKTNKKAAQPLVFYKNTPAAALVFISGNQGKRFRPFSGA